MSPFKIRRNVSKILFQDKIKGMVERYLFLLLLIPLFFIAYPLIQPGISITGDFPYWDTGHYAANRLWMWVERGSIDGFEFVSRFPIIGLFSLLSFVGVNSELATKAMVLSGFLLSSFSFYFSFLLFFKSRSTDSNICLRIAAIVGSLLFAYNAWSVDRIHHWYLWIGYSLFPLFFVSTFFSFKYPKKWKYILISIFLWSIASTTPHMTVFYGIIFLFIFLGFVINYWYKRKNPITVMIPMILIFSFYFMVNIYWIYPYILASQTPVLTPRYELTEEDLELKSRDSDFLNAFRAETNWMKSDEIPSENSLFYYLWLPASFVIPIIAFSSLILKRSMYQFIFAGIALIGILFAMGMKSPLNYYELALSTPILSNYFWVFREPDKLSFSIGFAYSFLIGIISYYVLATMTKKKYDEKKKVIIASLFLFLLIGSIFLSSYPFFKREMDNLKPVLLPAEFDELNTYFSTVDTDKIFFIPYPQRNTQWNSENTVGSIYQIHSTKPSIESGEYISVPKNYYNFLAGSIVENRSNNIGNIIYPLGTSYLVFHNDTSENILPYEKNIDLLKRLYFLEDLKNISKIGFYNIFKINGNGNNDAAGEINIPSNNIAILNGLDTINSLNKIPSFNTLQSSVLFLDDILTNETSPKSFDELILDRFSSDYEFALHFVDDKYVIVPSDATMRHEPSEGWSKSGARDPVHAVFHPHLKNLGIDNWDLDFGKGLVMTKATGSKLSVPIEIGNQNENNNSEDNNFYLFMRYLKNQKGGIVKIYVDNKLLTEVDTLDKISNNFVWEKIGNVNLTKGRHTLTLENVAGLNAVNIFALIPSSEMNSLITDTSNLLAGKTRLIYPLEAESNFYNKMGTNIGSHDLFNYNSNVNGDNGNGSFTKTFNGQFKTPTNTDLVALQFLAKQNPDSNSSYSVRDLDFVPAYDKYNVFTSDFERKKASVPLTKLGFSNWTNYDRDVQSTSRETNKPIYGNNSLRVDLKQGDKPGSNRLATTFIPISDEAYYNATLDISAKDVKQLQSRILYYDANKEEMEQRDFIFKGKDGTFRDTFTSSILPPKDSKYLKFQLLTASNNTKPSTYLLDNVRLDEIIPSRILSKDNFTTFEHFSSKRQDAMNLNNNATINVMAPPESEQDLFKPALSNGSTSGFYKTETASLPIVENRVYNYTMTVDAENLNSLEGIALFKSSKDVVENSTRYGNNASNGRVLSLSPGSEINSRIEIIKPSNYTLALRARTCETCTFLNVSMESPTNGDYDNYNKYLQRNSINLKEKDSGLNWLYSNSTYKLNKGTYEIKIYSDSNTDLDAVMLYENNNMSSKIIEDGNQTLGGIFSGNSDPAKLFQYKKINPTKYVLEIKNATRPYTVSLAEAYDPLWSAHVENVGKNNDFKTNSFPLYGAVNGFYVNKTGDYSLVIEYQPQIWFIQGLTVSTLSIAGILIAFILARKKSIIKLVDTIKRKISI